MNQQEEYERIFIEAFSLSEKDLQEDIKMGSIADWDSIGHMKLITMMEDSFDLMFETEDILNFNSYEKGKEILRKYGVDVTAR